VYNAKIVLSTYVNQSLFKRKKRNNKYQSSHQMSEVNQNTCHVTWSFYIILLFRHDCFDSTLLSKIL